MPNMSNTWFYTLLFALIVFILCAGVIIALIRDYPGLTRP